MLTLIRDGGPPMLFVIAFGLITLGTAFWFALRPDARHEGFIKWMGRAMFWAILNGICTDIAKVASYLAHVDPQPDAAIRSRILLEGFSESMSPGILGFAALALIALLTAVGRRRLDARLA